MSTIVAAISTAMVRFQLLKARLLRRVRPTVGPLVGDAVRKPDVRLVIAEGDVRNRPLTRRATRVERQMNNNRNRTAARRPPQGSPDRRSGRPIPSAAAGRPGLPQIGADRRPRHLPDPVVEACHADPALELGDPVDQHRVADRRVDRRRERHLVDAGLDGGGLGLVQRPPAAVWKADDTPVGSSMNASRENPTRRSRRRPSGTRGSRFAWRRPRRSVVARPRSSWGAARRRTWWSMPPVASSRRFGPRPPSGRRVARGVSAGSPRPRRTQPTQREHDRRGSPRRRAPLGAPRHVQSSSNPADVTAPTSAPWARRAYLASTPVV